MTGAEASAHAGLRKVVLVVALLNLAYFGVEFAVALAIGSVSLFADSVDFLEDASVNPLIFVALAWSARARARVGMALRPPSLRGTRRRGSKPRRATPARSAGMCGISQILMRQAPGASN